MDVPILAVRRRVGLFRWRGVEWFRPSGSMGYNPRLTLPPRQLGNTEATMVKIRLTRGGAKKRPFYHVIVTDQRSARDGRNIERVGYYNPVASGNDKPYELDLERMKHWVGLGAQMSGKVADLYKQASKAA
jgi:small subunit ribosomal protein S16